MIDYKGYDHTIQSFRQIISVHEIISLNYVLRISFTLKVFLGNGYYFLETDPFTETPSGELHHIRVCLKGIKGILSVWFHTNQKLSLLIKN